MLESLLDDIPKLGESRRRALLEVFGSVSAIRKASVAEISAIPGIGNRVEQAIFDHLKVEHSPESSIEFQVDMETGEIS